MIITAVSYPSYKMHRRGRRWAALYVIGPSIWCVDEGFANGRATVATRPVPALDVLP